MVWYTPQARFTLMSNSPIGDVHAIFPCPSPGSKTRVLRAPADSSTKMNIKLSRAQGVLEIARYVSPGEWTTKSLSVGEEDLKSGGGLGHDLSQEEREGLDWLVRGLKVCEAAEGLCVNEGLEEAQHISS